LRIAVEIRHLRSFVTVAVAGSITRAARQLNLAQPAVSQHVHALEIELGVMLFRRTSRGVTLTEAGMALLGPSRSLLAAEAEARTSVQQIGFETRAEVEIASIPSAAGTLLPRAVRLLHDQSTPFRLRVFEQASDGCLALLAARMVELAIVRDLQPEAGFASEELLHEDLVLAIPSAHPLAMHAKPTLEMFRNENFFMFDFRTGVGLHRMAMEACSAAGFVPRILCEGPEAGTMGQLVSLGLGVAIVPRSVLALWDRAAVTVVQIDPAPTSRVFIARLPGEPLSERAQRVARALRRIAGDVAAQAS
jgi:LysR family transcriptional regulator, salicylic acid-responsive activator of bsdBCD